MADGAHPVMEQPKLISRCAQSTVESVERDCVRCLYRHDMLGGSYHEPTPSLFTADDESSLNSIHFDRPERERNMSLLHNRLATFKVGPSPWSRVRPTAEELANVGFYYTGYEHRVECHSCSVIITDWDGRDHPLIKHHDKSPSCKFLLDNFQSKLTELLSFRKRQHGSPLYSSSSSRLHSFSKWPFGHLVPSFQLASVGFYYSGFGSTVCCFSCGLEYDRWRTGDIPINIHRQYSPQCPFLNSLLGNDPFVSSPLPSLSDSTVRAPDYVNEVVRLKSFKHLPKTVPASKEECAKAGLYFLRKPDIMKCFSCDAVVRCWIEGDIPVEKHRGVSPNCKFLKEFFPNKLDSPPAMVDPNTLPEPEYNQAELKLLSHEDTTTSKIDPSSLPEPFLTPSSLREPNQQVSSVLSVEDQSSSLDDSKTCVVCMDAPLQMVLVPCGHMCVCEECSSQILQCPLCRTPTENALKVFLP